MVSSLAQLAFSDSSGIGLSGIGYALFGFIYVKRSLSDAYRNFLDKKTINLFLFWLVLCIVLTSTGAWAVGNAAHIGGLLWGVIIAYTSKYNKYMQLLSGSVYIALLIILIFYSPLSTSYLSYKAYDLHQHQKVNEAMEVYKEILKRKPGSEFAKENLKQLELHLLQEEAFKLHTNQKYIEARQLYIKILSIDNENEWAKEGLSRLSSE